MGNEEQYKQIIETLQKELNSFNYRLKKATDLQKKWRERGEQLLIANNRLEKEIKELKKLEAKKMSGFLKIGAIYEPKIDRDYK